MDFAVTITLTQDLILKKGDDMILHFDLSQNGGPVKLELERDATKKELWARDS